MWNSEAPLKETVKDEVFSLFLSIYVCIGYNPNSFMFTKIYKWYWGPVVLNNVLFVSWNILWDIYCT